jgi:hypothetical protein
VEIRLSIRGMEWLLLLVGWLMFTAVVGVVVHTIVRWRGRGRSEDGLPRCGKCGYAVCGLRGGHVCPECGSDLRAVGIDQ